MRQRDRKHAGQPHSCLAYLSFLLPSTQGFNGEKNKQTNKNKKKYWLDWTVLLCILKKIYQGLEAV